MITYLLTYLLTYLRALSTTERLSSRFNSSQKLNVRLVPCEGLLRPSEDSSSNLRSPLRLSAAVARTPRLKYSRETEVEFV